MQTDGPKLAAVLKDPKHKNPDNLWCTSHSSVYDIANKTLSVAVYENFDNYRDYKL